MPTFKERYEYLRLGGEVGKETFGFDRHLNQMFYKSKEWLRVRDFVILRDTGSNEYCQDLGVDGHNICGRIIVHHINPLSIEDIVNRSEFLLDPEYLISTSHMTHEAITYGDESLLIGAPIERTKNDTCPWRR